MIDVKKLPDDVQKLKDIITRLQNDFQDEKDTLKHNFEKKINALLVKRIVMERITHRAINRD